jgi:tight adherence protein C
MLSGVVISLLVGVSAVAVGAALWFVWHRLQPVLIARRQQRQINQVMPDTVELFVLIVHAGLTPRQAVEELAVHAPLPVRHGFGEVVAKLERGESLADALRVLPNELGCSAVALADIVGSADRYGLALGPVLEQLATESRATRRRLDEAAARSLPVKLSFPLVVCTLPSFVLLAIIPAVLAALSSLGGNAW